MNNHKYIHSKSYPLNTRIITTNNCEEIINSFQNKWLYIWVVYKKSRYHRVHASQRVTRNPMLTIDLHEHHAYHLWMVCWIYLCVCSAPPHTNPDGPHWVPSTPCSHPAPPPRPFCIVSQRSEIVHQNCKVQHHIIHIHINIHIYRFIFVYIYTYTNLYI